MDTPRGYISWSQMVLVERSPSLYVERYLGEGHEYTNKYMTLGKKLAERMEIGLPTDDKLLEHLVLFLPKGKYREYEMEVDFDGIPLKGKLDQFTPKPLEIRETKTGKRWTQSMAEKHGQLKFYATMVYVKYGKMPKIFLDWVPTRELDDGTLEMTGQIKTFEVMITFGDIILFRARIKKAWETIKRLTDEHYKDFVI